MSRPCLTPAPRPAAPRLIEEEIALLEEAMRQGDEQALVEVLLLWRVWACIEERLALLVA
jgi:hypothetical protein